MPGPEIPSIIKPSEPRGAPASPASLTPTLLPTLTVCSSSSGATPAARHPLLAHTSLSPVQ